MRWHGCGSSPAGVSSFGGGHGILMTCPGRIRSGLVICGFAASRAPRLTPKPLGNAAESVPRLDDEGLDCDRIVRDQRGHRHMWPCERREVERHVLGVLDLGVGRCHRLLIGYCRC